MGLEDDQEIDITSFLKITSKYRPEDAKLVYTKALANLGDLVVWQRELGFPDWIGRHCKDGKAIRRYSVTSPRRTARRTASVRFSAPSFPQIADT